MREINLDLNVRLNMSCHVMSCHVIVRNRLSLSMGSRDVAAGANPSLVSAPAHHRALTDEQCGVQYLAQGHFDMQLSLARLDLIFFC